MIRSVKICMVCCLTKPVKYESDYKSTATFGKKKDNGIHEYNYSCYECLDNLQKEREKQLREVYDRMKEIGIIDK